MFSKPKSPLVFLSECSAAQDLFSFVIFLELFIHLSSTFDDPNPFSFILIYLFDHNLHSLQDESKGEYTGDGSIDINGNRVLRSGTGGWKACPFILGTTMTGVRLILAIATHL